MQIIIPMSGFGERFRKAGYKIPKPLIEVEGKPIIAHVIDLFPDEEDFIFICNKQHLQNKDFGMEKIIEHYCPTGKIVSIDPHKLGPVHAVLQVEELIDAQKPTVVNYCDFTCYWDWKHFKNFVMKTKCDGAIPSYKGFHPHSLGTTNYAYIKEQKGSVIDIQEKQPFTEDRMNEFASSGTYYFSSGLKMLDSFKEMKQKDLDLNGEYYVSLAYKILLETNNKILVYPLQHFMQWGTPEDVDEYNYWSKAFKEILKKVRPNKLKGSNIIPMAGLGTRFSDEGFKTTKPLIEISGSPMVIQSCDDLPNAKNNIFVVRSDMPDYDDVKTKLKIKYPTAIIKTIDKVTDGQARTASIGLEALRDKCSGDLNPITIGACDSGATYDAKLFESKLNDPNIDILVWGIRGYANAIRSPKMYGWLNEEDNVIKSISVKKPLLNPKNDPIILGVFTFKDIEVLQKALNSLFDRNGRVNNEFYMDSCIEDAISLGYKCELFEVESYLCWGTPNDMQTFKYWQSCFHQWDGHSYSIFDDISVPKNEKENLVKSYSDQNPVEDLSWINKDVF